MQDNARLLIFLKSLCLLRSLCLISRCFKNEKLLAGSPKVASLFRLFIVAEPGADGFFVDFIQQVDVVELPDVPDVLDDHVLVRAGPIQQPSPRRFPNLLLVEVVPLVAFAKHHVSIRRDCRRRTFFKAKFRLARS